jgi:hypothetical protein
MKDEVMKVDITCASETTWPLESPFKVKVKKVNTFFDHLPFLAFLLTIN